MDEKKAELALEQGRRVKQLLKEHKWTQKSLSEAIHQHAGAINAKLSGKRTITMGDAKDIAKLFPPVRWQWIAGQDNFKFPEDVAADALNRAKDDAKLLEAIVRRVFSDCNYSLKPLSQPELEEYGIFPCDVPYFALVKEGMINGIISYEDYFSLRREIASFSRFTVQNAISKAEKSLFQPIPIKEGD